MIIKKKKEYSEQITFEKHKRSQFLFKQLRTTKSVTENMKENPLFK